MKLVVMIPAYNEEDSIASVIKEIPRDCCDEVEVLVVSDGSTDNTAEEAKKAGADRIVISKKNRGLAPTFKIGLQTALEMGADIIVNTDGDGQYNGNEIPKLIQPVLDNKADLVLGSRTKGEIEYMPLHKKIGNRMATFITRHVSGLPVSDGQSGFRAFSRDCALRLNVMADYTYVQETLIQASYYDMAYTEVPIEFRKREGSSRLISNIFNYARRAGTTIARGYRDFHPLKTFSAIAGIFLLAGFVTGGRVLVNYFNTGAVGPYLPSAILTVLLFVIAILVFIVALVADMLKTHRKIQDEMLYRLKKIELEE
ncbi:glycosyltransferase family 2 protein [Methanohalophilus mahii]|uniref:Glycosyl transferase family 2 n=1 Tax=Methanohalophilus mahii (strain ATCC 35705 / DSM 5219 / SLP) TaxID=547558 RepID=D5E8X3_METMS|nr:glycosyltransferase family 2 protein [Methanohalophilus mahii]ADE35632.1 glycosyl transferase family 2 [Methanohalophilus mahii DSM 5219]